MSSVQINTSGRLVLGGAATVDGDFANSGTLTANGRTVTFDGSGTHNLAANAATAFANLTVANSTVTLVETVAANNATVTGSLTNHGTIRKTRTIGGTGTFAFGLTGVQMDISTRGTLASLQVDRVDSNHPMATDAVRTGRYWSLTPNIDAGGYTLALTLPRNQLADPTVCRYTGVDWDCARDSFGASTVTRSSITALSDWAVGGEPPSLLWLPLVIRS